MEVVLSGSQRKVNWERKFQSRFSALSRTIPPKPQAQPKPVVLPVIEGVEVDTYFAKKSDYYAVVDIYGVLRCMSINVPANKASQEVVIHSIESKIKAMGAVNKVISITKEPDIRVNEDAGTIELWFDKTHIFTCHADEESRTYKFDFNKALSFPNAEEVESLTSQWFKVQQMANSKVV